MMHADHHNLEPPGDDGDAFAREALGHLEGMLGPGAAFRPQQLEAVRAIVQDRGRVLLVQRTGWGKSAVYFIATRMLRDRGAGPTLLVSPLLALMRNQIAMAERVAVRARTINSTNPDEFEAIRDDLEHEQVDLLLISPERLNNERFRQEMLPLVAHATGLLVVDEAHCISDWGHDFRPDYRRIVRVLDLLPAGVPVLCTTATANDRVIEDLHEQLGSELVTHRGPLDRESLTLAVARIPSQAGRLAWLAATVPTLPGSGVIYTLTVADTTRVATFLRSKGIEAEAYSGEAEHEDRLLAEDKLLRNEVKALVATSALGMGYDKPDLGFVIHYQTPGSPIAYYQQVGRAGRALEQAPAIALQGYEDQDIQDFFIESAFPPKRQAEQIVRLLAERSEPMSLSEILAEVNVRKGRLETLLKVLEVEGAVQREGGKWLRTLQPWSYDEERVRRVTEQRRREQRAMVEYAETDGCLMGFLRRELDDPDATSCGRCMTCTGERPNVDVDPGLVAEAEQHLRTADLLIEPRKQWPPGFDEPKGKIPEPLRADVGRALSVYNDGGWGRLVRRGKFETGAFDERLIEASARLILDRWLPDPFPKWVTWVPSRERPELVPSFARALADALSLPAIEAVRKIRDSREQKEMENSAQQLRNVLGAFEVETSVVEPSPVLIVDDILDSGWTLTVIASALLEAGCGPVHPFVLARALSR